MRRSPSTLRTQEATRFQLANVRVTSPLSGPARHARYNRGRFPDRGWQYVSRSEVDCEKWLAEKRPQLGAGGPSPVAPGGARPACMMTTTRQCLTAGTKTIQNLSVSLLSLVGRPVVDRTGLSGTFNMDLQWTSGVAPAPTSGNTPPPDEGASIFTALQEQLGLRLEPARGPFEILVIDSVQRPTPD